MKSALSSDGSRDRSASGMAVRVATFVAALLLSLLCGLLYNAWKYEKERITLSEGAWHSRLLVEAAPETMGTIRGFKSVRETTAREQGADGAEPAIDLHFRSAGAAIADTPRIAESLGLPPEKIAYHDELLALYLRRAPGDTAPRLLLPAFALIALAASLSLILLIHNAFAVSMNAKIRQIGILSSVGATPRQVRACLLREAAALSAAPVLAGSLTGIALCAALVHLTNALPGGDVPGRHEAVFGYHPTVLALTLLVAAATVFFSARLPAGRLGRMTPLEALKNPDEAQWKRKKSAPLLSLLFGAEGELAGNALRAQKKALRTASASFVLSFLAFSCMLCFFTLSGISTRETYFERYQGVWDVMATVKGADVEKFGEAEAIRALEGVESAIVYQKAAAERIVAEDEISSEMKAFGGFAAAPAEDAARTDGGWRVSAPLVILDDASFSAYCEQIGVAPRLDGAVILNCIRDVTNPDFRHPVFMPYLTGESGTSALRRPGDGETAEVPVLGYTQEVPALREEYATLDYYELVHFLPASLWREIGGRIGGAEGACSLCVRAGEGATLGDLNDLQGEIARLIGGKYDIEQENRIQEYETNGRQIRGMTALFGGFCALLAIIGIGGVFSSALGFVRQRRREFARYLSVGLTPGALKKMFCIEAAVVAGRPILVGLPLVAAAVGLMLRAGYIELRVFMAEAPVAPVALFALAIAGSVALAYALAWGNMRKMNLAEALRDDTLM